MIYRPRKREAWEWLIFWLALAVAAYLIYQGLQWFLAGLVMFVLGFLLAMLALS